MKPVKLNVINLEKSEYPGGKSSLCLVVGTTRFPMSSSKRLGRTE